jgi:uncharacterized membrane protein YdjX (TVP38/TMEM64 family)
LHPSLVSDFVAALSFDSSPSSLLLFGSLYLLFEVLAVPCFPFTGLAGYLFGVPLGALVCWCAGTVAAVVSFLIGRTLLTTFVQAQLEAFPKLRALDKAFELDGKRLVLLLRLSPFFPFALSNYIYGGTSVSLADYAVGTMLGQLPGTIGYVAAGAATGELAGGGLSLSSVLENPNLLALAAGGALLFGVIGVLTDISGRAIEAIEREREEEERRERESKRRRWPWET